MLLISLDHQVDHPLYQPDRFGVIKHPAEPQGLEVAIGLVVMTDFLVWPEGYRGDTLLHLTQKGFALGRLVAIRSEPDLAPLIHLPHAGVIEASVGAFRWSPDHAVTEGERSGVGTTFCVQRS